METQNQKREWVPAVPLPYYGIRKMCSCGEKFWKEENYEKHYIVEHIYKGKPDYKVKTNTMTLQDYIQKDIERLEVMKRKGLETKVRGNDDFESISCDFCGGYDECNCEGFNEALQTIIDIKRKELEELNEHDT